MLVINPETQPNDTYVLMGKDKTKIVPVPNKMPIRILGVWFKAEKGIQHNVALARKEIANMNAFLSKKMITVSQLVYINNAVLIPRLEYRLKTCIMEDVMYETLYRPIVKTLKNKAHLPSNTQNNILTHPGTFNLRTLWDNQLAAQITELIITLNSPSPAQCTTEIRLKQAQLALNITMTIIEAEPRLIVLNKIMNNHAYGVLRKAKDYMFSIQTPHNTDDWKIQGTGPDIRSWLSNLQDLDRNTVNSLAGFWAKHNIFYRSQLLREDNVT